MQDGARVAMNGRLADTRLAAAAAASGAHPAPADISDPDAVRGMVAEIENSLGSIDILVANHAYMSMSPLIDCDLDDWWRVIDTNLGGTFSLIQAVLPGMRRGGGGRIVVISSEWGVTGWPNATAYAASKAGLISLTKTLGRELAPEGIIVNAVAPGVVDTPQLEVDARDAQITRAQMVDEYASEIPLGRIGQPHEIASAAALLADPRLSSMVGQVLQVNGGLTRCRG